MRLIENRTLEQKRLLEVGVIIVIIGMVIAVVPSIIPSPHPSISDFTSPLTPVEGTINITLVLAKTENEAVEFNSTHFLGLLKVNVSSYFEKQSYSKVKVTGRIVDWVDVPEASGYYRNNRRQLFSDAVNQVHWTWSNYTEYIIVVRSGSSYLRACYFRNPRESIVVESQLLEVRGCVVAENDEWTTWAHELGHAMGLDDLYKDDEYSHLGEFVGEYDLMAQHGWSMNPSDLSGYSRIRLGWITSSQIMEVKNNSTIEILDINSQMDGYKILMVTLNSHQAYLLEARNGSYESGLLISLIDLNRPTGGEGRIEIARNYRSLSSFSGSGSIFRTGESYIDSINELCIDVIDWIENKLRLVVTFVKYSHRLDYPFHNIEGIEDVTCFTTSNGTNYIGICTYNPQMKTRQINLYEYRNGLRKVANSSIHHDSFNLVIIEGRDGDIALVYERIDSGNHQIVTQASGGVAIISGQDDARNPTSICNFNKLRIAYENHTFSGVDIVVLHGSPSWSDTPTVYKTPDSVIESTSNWHVSNPQLQDNYYSILAYLNSSSENTFLEIRMRQEFEVHLYTLSIHDSHSYGLGYFSPQYLSITFMSDNQTIECILFDTYNQNEKYSSSIRGILFGSVFAAGQWILADINDELVIQRIFNRHYEEDIQFNLEDIDDDILFVNQISYKGSPAIILFVDSTTDVQISIQSISSLPLSETSVTFSLILIGAPVSLLGLVLIIIHYVGTVKIQRN